MQTLLSAAACLLLLAATPPLGWAQPLSSPPRSGHLRASPPRQERLRLDPPPGDQSPPPARSFWQRLHRGITSASSYRQLPKQAQRIKDLPRELEEDRLLSVLPQASLLDGAMKAEAEVAFSVAASSASVTGRQGLGDARHRLLRFGLTGTEGPLRYGASFREAGSAFLNLQDQAQREVWAEWQWGIARLKGALSESWNNLDKDPRRSRLSQSHQRLTLMLAPPSWPELTLAYARGASASSSEPNGTAVQRGESETVEAGVSYAAGAWSTRLSSGYLVTGDLLRPGTETIGQSYSWTGSYRPTQTLSITSALGLREEHRQWSDVWLDTPTASVSLSYDPAQDMHLSALGSFNHTESTDHLVDNTAYAARSALSWTTLHSALRETLTFEAGYSHALDAVRARSTEELSGVIRLQLAGL
jgi:hypothetical protein